MRWRNGALLGGCLLMAVASCSDDEKEPPPPVGPVVQNLATSVCDLAFRCCTRGEVSHYFGPFYDAKSCPARLMSHSAQEPSSQLDLEFLLGIKMLLPNLGALEQANLDGRGTVNAAGVQACIDYLNKLACPAWVEPPADDGKCHPPKAAPEPTPCEPSKLFSGLVGEGGACTSGAGSLECATGLVCRTDSQLGVAGRCVKLGEPGASCSNDTHCQEKLYCSMVDGTCHAYGLAGEACGYSDRNDPHPDPATLIVKCEAGLSCDWLTELCVVHCQRGAACGSDKDCDSDQKLICVDGRCDLPRAQGLPCAQDADCVEGLRCGVDPMDSSLEVCVQLLPDGEGCANHTSCQSTFCDPVLHKCSPTVGASELCASHLDAQCADGRCTHEPVSCASNDDCPITQACDLTHTPHTCGWYCVPVKPDGAACQHDDECKSGQCIAGFCRTPPLKTSEDCDSDSQCESGFCGRETKRVCTELPLPIGARCSNSSQCESLVCFDSANNGQSTCSPGLGKGEFCSPNDPDVEPCNPFLYYCDTFEQPKGTCVRLRETGEDCDRSEQCRGDCEVRYERKMCTAVAPPKAAMCDGNTQPAP